MSKVVDRDEAIRLLRGGMTLQGMVDYYLEEYGISTTIPMWSRFRAKVSDNKPVSGLRQYEQVPWVSTKRAKGSRLRQGLLAVARQMSGMEMTSYTSTLARQFKARLESNDTVVDYDPVEDRYIEVPRRAGIDQGWVRDPFFDDEGRFISGHGAFIRSNAYDAYIRSGGMSLQDMERKLPDIEKRRDALDLRHIATSI